MKSGNPMNYEGYVKTLSELRAVSGLDHYPKVIVLFGPSEFLRQRAIDAYQVKWKSVSESEVVSVEGVELDASRFLQMSRQSSLFDPHCLYVIRRCEHMSKLPIWMKEIRSSEALKNTILFEFSEKPNAETNRQLTRLHATVVPCFEPSLLSESTKIMIALLKRANLELTPDGLALLRDSVGNDLAKLNNEIQKIILVFSGQTKPLSANQIAPIVGIIREDHVFELFKYLREKNFPKASLLVDQLLDRGEKGIALTGILARYAREAVQSGKSNGVAAVMAIADSDQHLKSSRMDDGTVLANALMHVID
ncbi:MAG: hypothetical protein NT027_06525 [Proteobacteria bacterium]|nr:hypothetical protein [Pseudomonadota bacterium]